MLLEEALHNNNIEAIERNSICGNFSYEPLSDETLTLLTNYILNDERNTYESGDSRLKLIASYRDQLINANKLSNEDLDALAVSINDRIAVEFDAKFAAYVEQDALLLQQLMDLEGRFSAPDRTYTEEEIRQTHTEINEVRNLMGECSGLVQHFHDGHIA
jgi:hypothetical protein